MDNLPRHDKQSVHLICETGWVWMGVSNNARKATERTPFVPQAHRCETAEKFEFFLSRLSVLYGEKGFVLSQLDTSGMDFCIPKLGKTCRINHP